MVEQQKLNNSNQDAPQGYLNYRENKAKDGSAEAGATKTRIRKIHHGRQDKRKNQNF